MVWLNILLLDCVYNIKNLPMTCQIVIGFSASRELNSLNPFTLQFPDLKLMWDMDIFSIVHF
jgi:hypothetical protein